MTIKLAIVGTGKVARNNYLPYLAQQSDVELSYFSRTLSKAEACAAEFGGHVFGSLEALVRENPDTILVLTREEQRYEVTMNLLKLYPKRLFFEKPLVAQNGQANVCEDDFTKAHILLTKAAEVGTETAMVFNYRFFDQTQRALEIVDEHELGELTQASLFVNYACWSHCIDLLHLFGGKADCISALSGETSYDGAVDVAASFTLLNGACGVILGTNGSQFTFPLYKIIFNYTNGAVYFSDLDVSLSFLDHTSRNVESRILSGNHSRWDQYKASFEKSLSAYLDAIRNQTPPPVPGLAGLEELQFEAALRRSTLQQRPVDVQKEFPINL